MKFSKSYEGDIVIYSLSGDFDIFHKEEFEADSMSELKSGKVKFIINMKGVTYIDSSAVGVLVQLASQTSEKGYKLKLCALTDVVKLIINMLKLESIFEFFPSVDEAKASFK